MADRSGYIGRAPGDSSVVIARQEYTPSGVTTDFTFTSGYTVGYIDCYVNGSRLIEATDYTATDGATVSLTSAANSGDVLELVAYKAFNLGNVASAAGDFEVGNQLTVVGATTATSAYYTGVVTATSFSGSGANLTGVGTQGLNVQAQSITVAGVSTFADDVRVLAGGVDVTSGIVSATGLDIGTNGIDVDGQTDLDELVVAGVATFSAAIDAYSIDLDGQADLDELVVAGVSTFSAKSVFNTAYPSIDADNEIQVGTAIQLGKAGIATALGLDISTGGVDIDGQTDLDEVVIAGVTTASDSVNVSGGTITVGTGITIAAVAGFATFSSGVKLGKGGILCEGISSVTAGFDNTSDLNLDNGMVHYTSDALAGNANTLNITSSVGINTAMAVNDMIVVTGITSVSSTSHYVNALTIDHNPPRQISWVGGAAPTAGGSTGFDTYTFTIWKTGNGGGGVTSGQFMVIANHTTTTA